MPIYTRPDFGGGEADPYSSGYGHPDTYGVSAFMKSNPDQFNAWMAEGIGLDGIQKRLQQSGQGGVPTGASNGMYQPGNPLYGLKGAGQPTGAGAGTTSITGASSGSVSPFDVSAQAAQIRDDMRQIRERSKGALDETMMESGIFSSGVRVAEQGRQDRGYGLQEASMLERLRNDASERSFRMQQAQQEAALRAAGGGSQRFGTANETQAMMDAYGASQSFGGSPTGSTRGGGAQGGMATQPAGQTYSPTGEPMNKNAPNYFNEWQAWYRNKSKPSPVGGDYGQVGSGDTATSPATGWYPGLGF